MNTDSFFIRCPADADWCTLTGGILPGCLPSCHNAVIIHYFRQPYTFRCILRCLGGHISIYFDFRQKCFFIIRNVRKGYTHIAGFPSIHRLLTQSLPERIFRIFRNGNPFAILFHGCLYLIGVRCPFKIKADFVDIQCKFQIQNKIFSVSRFFGRPGGGCIPICGQLTFLFIAAWKYRSSGSRIGTAICKWLLNLFRHSSPHGGIIEILRLLSVFHSGYVFRIYRDAGIRQTLCMCRDNGSTFIIRAELNTCFPVTHGFVRYKSIGFPTRQNTRSFLNGKGDGTRITDPSAICILHRDDQPGILFPIICDDGIRCRDFHTHRFAAYRSFSCCPRIFLPVPVPGIQRKSVIIDHSHLRQSVSADGTVMEGTP